MIKILCLLVAALLAGMGSGVPAFAADNLKLVLQMNKGMLAGIVRDGTRLGRGSLVNYNTHTGFRFWDGQATPGHQGGCYILTGQQNPSHKLCVRLVPRQLAAAELVGIQGVVVHTSEDRVFFDIQAAGDQRVKADVYSMTINGMTLLP